MCLFIYNIVGFIMAGISLSNVFFGYDDINLLDGVSVAFGDSDIVAIVGDNGCGKTTLFRLLTGALLPDSGQVSINADVFMLNQINASDSKSGGEQQMLAMGRALMAKPKIIYPTEFYVVPEVFKKNKQTVMVFYKEMKKRKTYQGIKTNND